MTDRPTLLEKVGQLRLADAGFLVRRLLRRDTTRRAWFRDGGPTDAQKARLAAISREVRLADGPPVAVVHGVMPRSGTNYLHALLALHPDTVVEPLGVKELPFLAAVPASRCWQRSLLDLYRGNEAVFDDLECLAHMVAAFLRRAEERHKGAGLIVFKVPHTRFIEYFPALFPDDRCVILLREGRHVVQSTISTWPLRPFGKTFADICREWAFATEAALDFEERESGRFPVFLERYEDIVADPARKIREILDFLGLGHDRFPFERIADLPVLGSSELSRKGKEVTWEPVAAGDAFNPARRDIVWTARQDRTWERTAGQVARRAGYGGESHQASSDTSGSRSR